MANKKETKTNNSNFSEGLTFKFYSDSVLKTFEKDGKKYCRLTASSEGEDLVGDIMSQKALEQMKDAAVGTVMFMNHSHNVPEDVFGTVIETGLEKKKAAIVGGDAETEMLCLDYLVEVQEDNERALKTWQFIDKGTKLGASVTVLVRDKSQNPKRNKGMIIEEVEYLETSIVGIPCNRQSWVDSAQKALKLYEKREDRAKEDSTPSPATAENPIKTGEMKMEKETTPAAPAESAETASKETPENDQPTEVFARTMAAIAASKTFRASITQAGKKDIPIPEVVVKGMFNDEQDRRKPGLWDLYDILCAVKWQLMDRKWAMEWSGTEDEFDYVAEFRVACQEFAAAAVESFAYYGGFVVDPVMVSEDVPDVDDDDDDEIISSALEIEKSFKFLSEQFEKTSDAQAQKDLREIGEGLLGLAEKIGIKLSPVKKDSEGAEAEESDPAGQIPTEISDEEIEKHQKFLEMRDRAEKAEAELKDTQTELSIAKAGLKAGVEATGYLLRKPLHASGPKEAAATS